jgi:hypothetical protein
VGIPHAVFVFITPHPPQPENRSITRPMPSPLSLHLAVTWALAGLIHTIQWVHYPLFKYANTESFAAFHDQHSRRITWLVAPLMLAELTTAAWLFHQGNRSTPFLVSLPLLALIWISTGLIQVPIHERLAKGRDETALRRLVTTNHIRTLAWTARGILLLTL